MASALLGEQPGQRCEYDAVWPGEVWPGDLPAQHRHLVSEHEELGVLGRLPAGQQCEPAEELAEDQVEQSQRHDWRSSRISASDAKPQVPLLWVSFSAPTSWDHILGNMLFLAIFGKNVEDALGSLGYLVFYFAGGLFAMLTQTAVTLLFGSAADGQVPNLGASGAIAAVLGAYFVLYPGSRITTFVGWFLVRIPAWFFLGGWFLYQLIEANFGMFGAEAHGGAVAFFAHVGGFVFGFIVARVLARAGRIAPQGGPAALVPPD
jgi:membrane associated rhomboid family serine protease